MLAEQPRSEFLEQPVENEQSLQLLRVEPEPGQLIAVGFALAFVVVAAPFVVPFDGRIQVEPHLADQAIGRRFRAFELVQQLFSGYGGAPITEHPVQHVDSVELIQESSTPAQHQLPPRLFANNLICGKYRPRKFSARTSRTSTVDEQALGKAASASRPQGAEIDLAEPFGTRSTLARRAEPLHSMCSTISCTVGGSQ